MKHICIILLTACSLGTLSAQKKDSIGIDETIAYLNLKTAEIVGYDKLGISQGIFINKKKVDDGYLRKTKTGVEIFNNFKIAEKSFFTTVYFNPKHIVSIRNTSNDNVNKESPVGTIEIKFIGKVVIFNNNGESSTVDKINFNFLQTDPENMKRIYKAFMYLKALYVVEDSRFENLHF